MPPEELDRIYELPYTRRSHPSYREEIPALKPVQFSIVTHRGCFGSCSFCALTVHQGRIVQSRSKASILREARALTRHPDFRGVIQDVGGPTANMYMLSCEMQRRGRTCKDRLCLFPAICENLETDHGNLIGLLRELRAVKGINHVFVGSGVRYDLALEDQAYLLELCRHHVSGQLKVAPEHIAPRVLSAMGKPPRERFEQFLARYREANEALGLEQYIIPYFISGHPGCTLTDMIALAEYIRDMGFFIEQVQDFTPTPMTLSTCMYHTGLDPRTMEPIHVPRGEEKRLQRALLQFRDPRNHRLVYEALKRAGRMDLVGRGKKCLISSPPP
ncbi:MAG: DUF3362 domain-containing protein, partial [Euryarchaeota archaeon]|nr:DUF3362 domain-containing protein [Euryarchaeota archaeon]